jgi:hypothetical protein
MNMMISNYAEMVDDYVIIPNKYIEHCITNLNKIQ